MTKLAEKESRAHFEADLGRVSAVDAPAWLADIRASAAEHFGGTAFPTHRDEAWRETNVTPIVRAVFRSPVGRAEVSAEAVQAYLFTDVDWPQLVFVDGVFAPDLSRLVETGSGVHVGSLAAALDSDNEVARTQLGQHAEYSSAFVSLNTALLEDGAFVHISKDVEAATPIHFVFVSTDTKELASYPRNLYVLETSSEAQIIETYVGGHAQGSSLSNGVTEIVLGDNVKLSRYKVVNIGEDAYHLCTSRVSQARDTVFRDFAITLSGKIVRNELQVVMKGEGGECSLNGLYLNDSDRLIDNALNVVHATSRCYSRMAYKGILSGSSRAVFTGKVLVPQDSQRTDSDQLNNNLLLSDQATIDTKPQLEIFADDVKCTHGATVGSFPRELLFYFRTRGIDEKRAHGILTHGFAMEIVSAIGIDELRKRLSAFVFDLYCPDNLLK